MHVDLVVEAQRLAVAQRDLDHCGVQPRRLPLLVRVIELTEVGDARLLEVREVPAVMDDAHRVGLHEAHPESGA